MTQDFSKIRGVEDLIFRSISPNAGDPDCICSACGEKILDTSDMDEWLDAEQIAYHFPVRILNGNIEATLHTACFMQLNREGKL